MAKHDKLTGLMQPMERFARAINNSSAVARSTQTSKAGSIYIPNADGTATIIGEAAGVDETGAPAGRADFYGDTTPPSAPTGVTWTSESGAITGYWDGTLAEGVPADFSYVELRVDGESTLAGRLKVAGSTSAVDLTVGSSYDCYAVAVDVQGNVSAESEHTSVVVVNTVETVEADVSEVKDKAAALEAELDTTNQKVTQVVSDVEGVKTTAENAVEKADQSLTVATEAKQTATEVKTTADKAYADAESALTQSSEAKQTASELSGKVTEAVETANSAKTSATTAVQTVDSFKTEVSETYLTKDDAGTTYATKSSLTETADSITAKVEAAQATGDDALALAKGGVSKVEVQYAQNQSTTTAPTDGWSTTAPTWKDGYYVWQKTVTTRKDGSTTESAATCISGATGAAGADGVGYKANLLIGTHDFPLTGKGSGNSFRGYRSWDGKALERTDDGLKLVFNNNVNRSIQAPLETFGNVESGETVTLSFTYRGNLPTFGTFFFLQKSGGNMAYSWANEKLNTDGEWHEFSKTFTATNANVRTCVSILLFYSHKDLGSDYWVELKADSLMLTHGSGNAEWARAASELVGNGVSSITPQYYLSTSATECTGGSWSTTMPTWTSGTYIWTRSHVVYTDGTTADTTPVLDTSATQAGTALVKSTEVEQTVEGITTTVTDLTADMQEQQTLIRQSGNGVEVARKVDGAYTSTRTLMDDEGFHVLSSDGTELSSFEADTVELGKGNSNARIKLVNGQFVVYAGTKDSQAAGYLTSTDIMELLALNDYGNAMVNLHTGTKDANNSSINFQVNTMVDGALHKTASALLAVSEVNNSSSLRLNVDKVLTTRKSVFDLAYPVGAVYISYVSTSPASLFGGTWEQLTGVFLRAANDTNTGGADSVSHYHWQTLGTNATEKNVYIVQGENNDGLSARVIRATKINIIDAYGSNATGTTRQDTTYSTTVNNMPTYQDVYAWRRTA